MASHPLLLILFFLAFARTIGGNVGNAWCQPKDFVIFPIVGDSTEVIKVVIPSNCRKLCLHRAVRFGDMGAVTLALALSGTNVENRGM